MPASFVHLRTHSAYSLSEGALRLKDLVKLCRGAGMPAVAVTDTNNLFGALEFALAASEAGIQPIVGAVLSLADEAVAEPPSRAGHAQIVLLVQSDAGYRALMRLVSDAFLRTEPGEAPHITWSALAAGTDGLICLTGGTSGPVAHGLLEGRPAVAEAALARLQALFPGRLYVELQRHGLADEDRIEEALVELAYAHDLPLVATNDAYFADAGMYEAHDALLCIADGAYVAEPDRRRLTPEHRLKTPSEMRALFADLPEAVDNTVVIARRCAFMPERRAPILPHFPTGDGRSEAEELRLQAEEGLRRRLDTQVFTADMDKARRAEVTAAYFERLAFELGVIEAKEFPGYFLIVADFIQWAKRHDIPVGPGRGSGAGSVAAWALSITDLDPIRFGLLFERFLNPERPSMPDFDVDFCQDRRDEVIRYVQERYGDDRVAQIITFGKLQARAVLRDVGRVLQMPYGQVDRLCKLVPNNPAKPVTLQQAIDGEPQLQSARRAEATVAKLIDIALKLEGLYRHASTHAAGVVIGDRPLADLVALYRDPKSPMPVTQFNMKYVEQAGLVKFDFLGLKTLTVLQRAVDQMRHLHGTAPDLQALPLDDEATFAMLGHGDTTGVFQLESSGMRDVLRRLKPTRFEDIIALVALYRPGPMDNIPTFIEVKNGQKAAEYPHPSLQGILEETYGIMIYQEQVMQAAQILAGYTLGDADLLRRAMGKKIQAEMDAQKARFVDGAVDRGVQKAQAAHIFDLVNKFAGYGFNKSHAAAYALVAYQTAYLKANHPVEFFAASMTLDLGNTEKLNGFKQELDRLGIRLLPPDVNRSDAVFAVERLEDGALAIRYALGAIKGVGVEAMRAVVAARAQEGAFADVFDFAQRVGTKVLNRRQLENLTRAGAFDSLQPNRARLFEGLDTVLRHVQAAERDRLQIGLFGEMETPALPARPDWDALERLREEFEAVGFYLSAHPLDSYNLARVKAKLSNQIEAEAARGRTALKLAGIVAAKRESNTRTGKRMAFVTLSDTAGQFEVTLFTEVLAQCRDLLDSHEPLLVAVEVQRQEDGYRLTAQSVQSLDRAMAAAGSEIEIVVQSTESLPHLKAILDRQGPGRAKVLLRVPLDLGEEAEIRLPQAYDVTAAGRAAIKAVAGIGDVREA
ncbi:MAG: DNA polymerase III subunit alpha [Rhodospirillaceae bacterium]|nr:DNA polymerase III subunit alpha [Rhodospirillaceae bacterium]